MKPEDVGKLVKEKGIKIVDLKFNDLPEIDALRLIPHPYEFYLYFDI
ncbi:MAG: hypothetical protein WA148_03335 [Actinomycetota bacterium]